MEQGLLDWCSALSEDMVTEAMKRSSEADKPYAYVQKVLSIWQAEGRTSLREVQAKKEKTEAASLYKPLVLDIEAGEGIG